MKRNTTHWMDIYISIYLDITHTNRITDITDAKMGLSEHRVYHFLWEYDDNLVINHWRLWRKSKDVPASGPFIAWRMEK